MSFVGRLLAKFFSSDRRRVPRKASPDLVAYFWTGGYADPSEIRDISMDGLFLLTNEHWYPGTLVRLVVQQKGATEEIAAGKDVVVRAITIQSMVVQHNEEGVGLAFFFVDQHVSDGKNHAFREGATRKEVEKFLRPYLENS